MRGSFTQPDRALLALLVGARSHVAHVEIPALVESAGRLYLSGALLTRLDALGVGAGEHTEALHVARLDIAARNTLLGHALAMFVRGLVAASIPHRVVKGGALLAKLAHPGDRWLDDVDVLFSERDRMRVAAHVRARGLAHVPFVRHDGVHARLERDGTSADVEGPLGTPLDLHFTRRPLPSPSSDASFPTTAALADGLASHVIDHHEPDTRLEARLVVDLHLLRRLDPQAVHGAARASRVLARALGWLASVSAFENPSPCRESPMLHAWQRGTRRAIVLARDGLLLRALVPAREYLVRQDPTAAHASLTRLHVRRWQRIAGTDLDAS